LISSLSILDLVWNSFRTGTKCYYATWFMVMVCTRTW